jgi:hypothetical protein
MSNRLRWFLFAVCILIIFFLGIFPQCARGHTQAPIAGFAVMDEAELKDIQDCLARYQISITLTSGRVHQDGTRFVRGHDRTGSLWILVITEPSPGIFRIEQHRCKPPVKGE